MSDARAARAYTDVVAVERTAPGLVRVVTFSDAYYVDARGAGCNCPDKQHNDAPLCKHELAAIAADTDTMPGPHHVTDDLDEADCPDCAALPDGWPCATCYINGEKEVTA